MTLSLQRQLTCWTPCCLQRHSALHVTLRAHVLQNVCPDACSRMNSDNYMLCRSVVERLSVPGVRRLFVVDRDTRKVWGILSLSDVAAFLFDVI